MKLSADTPVIKVNFSRLPDANTRAALFNILQALEREHNLILTVVNFNELTQVSQGTQPTPSSGAALLWVNTGATPGNPKAFIVANVGGTIYTFASVQVA